MAFQYVVTAQKPTAVTKCISGNFTGPNDRNLLLAKNNKIEVYTIVAEGLRPIKEIPIYGKITVMKLFRPRDTCHVDYLFILTDRYHGTILYCKQNGDKRLEVITKASGDLSDPVGRPPDSGIIGIIDPRSKLIGLRLYEGVIKFLPYDIIGEELRPFNVKVEQLNMVDAQFLHGSTEPQIALIFQNTQGRHVHTLQIDERQKEVKPGPWGKENIDSEAQILISMPVPLCGVIIIGQSSVTYQNHGPKHISIALPDVKNTVTCYTPIDGDCSRIILGNQAGGLYMLVVKTSFDDEGVKMVEDMQISYLGEVSIPESMCYLDNGVVYIGSRLGDSQLIKFNTVDTGSGEPGVNSFKILENFANIGPIVDMCVVDLDRQGQNQLVTCSGAFKDGSLRVIRNGIGIHDHASFDLKSVRGMWPLRVGWGPEGSTRNDSLIISSINHTRVLKFFGEEVEEKDLVGFDGDNVTLHTANVCHDQIVQISDKEIRILNTRNGLGDEQAIVWKPDGNKHITVATGNCKQLLIACGNELHYFEIEKRKLNQVVTKTLAFEVACLSIDPLHGYRDEDDDDHEDDEMMDTEDGSTSSNLAAKLCAVGLWKDNTARIYQVPTFKELHCDVLSTDIIPRSIALVNFEGIHYCLSSLGDGNLVYYQLDPNTGVLSDKKTIQLTTCPTVLRVFSLQGGPTTVFACSDRPSVIYSSNKKLVISNVNLKRVNHMCVLDSDGFQNSLAIANEETVVLGTIDAIQKLHIRKVEMNECPRRITYQEETRTFAVSATRTDVVDAHGKAQPVRECASSRAKKTTKDANIASNYEQINDDVVINNLLIFDEVSWEVLHAYQFATNEEALSVMSCCLGEDTTTSYYVVGTAFVYPDETEPRNGRIVVFKYLPSENILEVITEKQVKGAVYSLCAIKGNVLASVNNTVSIYKWLPDEKVLRTECNRQGNVMALYMKSRNDFVLVGDLMRSLSVLNYKHVEGNLEEVARDYNPNWMTAVEIIDDETFIGAENFHNIIVCQKQQVPDIESDSVRLNEVGSFHVGDFINAFRHGTLVMKNVVETELKTKENSILYGTVAGSIGVVTGLEEESYHFLFELQKRLSKTMGSVGNIQHDSWRSFCTVRKTEVSRGFIDGDLIETFLDLPRHDKQKIAESLQVKDNTGKRNVTVDELIKKVEELSRLH